MFEGRRLGFVGGDGRSRASRQGQGRGSFAPHQLQLAGEDDTTQATQQGTWVRSCGWVPWRRRLKKREGRTLTAPLLLLAALPVVWRPFALAAA